MWVSVLKGLDPWTRVDNKAGASLIMALRVIYSIYWYYLAPALPYMEHALNIPEAQLGLIPLAFLLGAGIMQIPSGVLANRIGNVNAAILGLLLLSISGIGVSLSANLAEVMVFRVIGGVGAALFFSTAATVLTSLYPGHVGLMLGIYNASFGIGAGLGLVSGILYSAVGWRIGILALSIIGVAASLSSYYVLRGFNRPIDASIEINPPAIYVGLATAGFWGSYYALGNLLPTYASARGVSVVSSSLVTSILLFSSAIGGASAGIVDRVRRVRLLILALVALMSVMYLAALTVNPLLVAVSASVIGFSFELAITASYVLVVKGANPTMALATVNSIDMLLGMSLSPAFTILMAKYPSYLPLVMAASSMVPLALIFAKVGE